MLVSSILSFSYNIYNISHNNFSISVTFILSSANAVNLVQPKTLSFGKQFILSFIYTHFNTMKKEALGKQRGKRCNRSQLSNFTFFLNVFYSICILKSFNSHISVAVCSFFEFGTISKLCIRFTLYQTTNLRRVFLENICRRKKD